MDEDKISRERGGATLRCTPEAVMGKIKRSKGKRSVGGQTGSGLGGSGNYKLKRDNAAIRGVYCVHCTQQSRNLCGKCTGFLFADTSRDVNNRRC